MARFIIGTLFSLGAFCLAYFMEGGALGNFVLPSVLLIVILVPFFAVLAVWSLRELGGACGAAFSRSLSREEGAASAALWDFFEKALYAAGVVGTLAGFIIIFRNAGSGETRMLVYSIALTPLIEAILLGLVARILRARVEKNARAGGVAPLRAA
jgi:flagellar motor component MotA